jgi:hypothetical protein
MSSPEPRSIADTIVSRSYWNSPLRDEVRKLYRKFEEAFARTGITLLFCPVEAFCEVLLWKILSTADITSQNPEALTDIASEIGLRTHAGGGNRANGAHVSSIRIVGLSNPPSANMSLTPTTNRPNMGANTTTKLSSTKCRATATV